MLPLVTASLGLGQSGITSLAEGITTGLATGITFITDTAVPAITSLVDAWNTGATDGGVMGGIQAVLDSLGTSVPGLEPLTTWLQTTLPGAVDTAKTALTSVGDAFKTVKGFIDDNVAVQATLLAGVTALGVAYGITTAAAIAHRVATAAGTVATTVMATAQGALNLVMNANPIGIVITALAGLAAGLVYAYNNSETFRNGVDTAWATVKQFAVDMVARVAEIQVAWVRDWNTIKSTVSGAVEGIKGFFGDLARSAGEKIGEVIAFFQGLPGKITGAVGNLGSLLTGAGKAVVQGLLDGINSMWNSVKSRLTELTNLIPDWKGPRERDAKLLTPSGILIMKSLLRGFDIVIPSIKDALVGLTGSIKTTVDEAFAGYARSATMLPPVLNAVGGKIKDAFAGYERSANMLPPAFSAVGEKIKDVFEGYERSINMLPPAFNRATAAAQAFNEAMTGAELQRSRGQVPGAKDRGNPYEGGKALPGQGRKQPRGGNTYGMPESIASSILPDSVVDKVRGNAAAVRAEFDRPAWQPVVGNTDLAFNLVQTSIHDHMALAGRHGHEVIDLMRRDIKDLMNWIDSLNNRIGGIRSIPGGGSIGGGGGTYTPPIYTAPAALPTPRQRPSYSASQSSNTRQVNIAPGAIVIQAPNADAREVGRIVDQKLRDLEGGLVNEGRRRGVW